MTRRKNGVSRTSSSESSPELDNIAKMPKTSTDGPPVTQAWLTTMFQQQSVELNSVLTTRLEESEKKIKAHLDEKVAVLNTQIAELQQDKERQSDRIEALEKMLKAKNIVVSGPKIAKEEVNTIIDKCLASAGESAVQLVDVRQITTKAGTVKFIAACTTMEEKSRIMKAKKSMAHNGKKVFVDSDLTREEQEIQFEARKFAKQQAEGSKVAVAYKKVWVNNACFVYDKSSKTFAPPKN